VLFGAISAVAVTLGKAKKAHDKLVSDADKLAVSQRQIAEVQGRLSENAACISKALCEARAAIDRLCAQQETLTDTYASAYGTLDSLRQAVSVGFCNDRELVQNGYAKEIARILEVKDEESA
jgi:hypothetical protein